MTCDNHPCYYPIRSAGLLNALTERVPPGTQDLQPDAEAHLLRYIEKASDGVLMQLTAHEATTKGRIFNAMTFVHLERAAKRLLRDKRRFQGTGTLKAAKSIMATRLAHRMRYYFKRSNSQDIAYATHALFHVLALESPGSISQEGRQMVTVFMRSLSRTSAAQTEKITPFLVCSDAWLHPATSSNASLLSCMYHSHFDGVHVT
jgi:hypothetical protein